MVNQFYVSIIFLGIILIVVAIIWIVYDKKRAYDYSKKIDEKKNELLNIISDAEQMVEELNKFSDYIVTEMNLKNEELCANLKGIEERIKQINVEHQIRECNDTAQHEEDVNDSAVDDKAASLKLTNSSDLIIENLETNGVSATNNPSYKPQSKVSEKKIIPLNSKHKEAMQLAESGLDSTEIARRLNMGKGEITLLLEMNKQYS